MLRPSNRLNPWLGSRGVAGDWLLTTNRCCAAWGSVQVQPGQPVRVGVPVAQCGNSGNSTEPHLHLQVSDSTDWTSAQGLPFAFRRGDGSIWVPANSDIIRN